MVKKQYSNLFLIQTKDQIWVFDQNLCLVYANKSYLNLMKELTGFEKELNSSILIEGFGEGYIEKWESYYQRALSGESFEIEEHFYNPYTKQMRYGHISFCPIKEDSGEIKTAACHNTDITEIIRKKDHANRLMDASLDVFCTIDEAGNFVFVSEAAQSHWGYNPQEMIGKPYQSFILAEDIPKTNDIADAIFSGEEINSFVNRYKRKDGNIAFNQWSARWDKNARLMYCVARDAKEKIEQETLLCQSEQRFKDLVQEGSDLIAILDADGTYRYVSPTSGTILGMHPDEFVGRNPIEFIHPDDVENTLANLKKISDYKKLQVAPFRIKNHKGEWRWIETILTNMLDNPAVNGIVANSRDITEKVNILKDIETNEQFNKTIIESSPDCLKILDNEGRLLFMNFNGLCQMQIDDFSKFKNIQWWNLWGEENELLVKESVEKALSGETVQFTAFCPTAKGTPKWWDVTVSPVIVSSEPIQKIISISRDITKKRQEEQQLKLLSSVITNTHDAILITDAEPFDEPGPRIIYVNEAFTKMTGYDPEEVIGKTPRMLQGPDSNREDLREFGKKLRRWESAEVTVLNYTKSGEPFWVNLAVSPVADQNGLFTHWVSIQREVTEQKIKERENELLTNISLTFNRENDYINACKGLCQTIGVFGGFDWVELWTVNIERSKIQFSGHFLHDPSDEVFYAETKGYNSFKKGSGLPGQVWQKKTQRLWSELEETKDFVRKEAAKKINLSTVLGIPLVNQNDVIGVLLVGSKKSVEYLEKYAGLFANFQSFIGSEINRKKLENDLNHLYESVPDIVCVADFQGRFLKMNPSGCHLLGYTEEEILYHSFDEFVFPADKDISAQEVAKLSKGQSVFSFENRYIQKNGEICWLSWTCNANLQEGIIYATARNITAEKKLHELNNVTSKMARIGSWEVDLQKNKIFWSEMVHQIHETDPQHFKPDITKGINFYREDFRSMVTEAINQCIQSGTPFDFEAVVITTKKNELWVRVIGKAELLNGECIRIYGSTQDIHDRKEADLRLQSLANNLPGVAIQYIIYPDGKDAVLYVTEGAEKLWGFTADQVMENLDLIWNQVKAAGDYDSLRVSMEKAILSQSKFSTRWRYVMPNGELRTQVNFGKATSLPDGCVLFNAVIFDVTQEAKNEELLEQATNMAKIGSWELDLINQEKDAMYWSPMTKRIFEVDEQYKPSLTAGLELYNETSMIRMRKAMDLLIQEGKEFDEELMLITSSGKEKWVRSIGKSTRINNTCIKVYGSFQDIHSSKTLEIQIRDILESISDNFYALDGELNFTYMNSSCANLLAVKKEKIIGKKLFAEFPELKNTQFEDELRKVQNTAESTKFEFYYAPFEAWFEESIYPTPTGISVYFADITQRKKGDAAIVKSEEKRRLIMNGALDAIITIETNEMISFWNPKAEVIFGWKAEEVMGKQLSEIIIPEPFQKYHVEGLKNYLKTGEGKALNVLLELSAIRRNGEEFPIELTVIPIKQGGEEFFCAFIRDITQRKKAESEIKHANDRFEKVTEATNDVIWDWDIESGTFLRSNAIDNFFGVGTSKVLNNKDFWNDNFHKEDIFKIKSSIQKAVEDPNCIRWEEEYRILNHSNEIIFVIDRGLILRNKQGKAIRMVGAMTDISERKRHEEQLILINQKLENQTKELQRSNEELEQFAFITSHDLQEPLRMISSFMDQLKRKYADRLDDKGLQYINFATDGAKRMKQIILDLLHYSRANRPSEQQELVNLNEVLSDFLQLRRKLISEKEAVIIYNDLPIINTYKAPITQIFHCLLDNALKYTIENVPPVIAIEVKEKEKFWEFAIKDNGIGIDPIFKEKIFVIFQRLQNRKEYDGTGIGLSIAKRCVEFLGGEIWLESKVGNGTTFYFTISNTNNHTT